MVDIGLLKHYPTLATKRGFLRTSKLGFVAETPDYKENDVVYNLNNGTSRYYVKYETGRDEVDSQVLLSQLLLKYGIGSAVYLPALDKNGHSATISDDIETSSCKQAVQMSEELAKRGIYAPSSHVAIQRFSLFDYTKLFTRDGIRQLLKVNLFAPPTFLDDLHDENVFYEYDQDGKISGVKIIDYSSSCDTAFDKPCKYLRRYSQSTNFVNNIGDKNNKTREQMVDELTHNEVVQHYLPTSEQVELVGNMAEDVGKVATDISQSTGYEVKQIFVDKVALSLSSFATELSQA